MKKQLALCLAFIVMLTSSCQKDPNTGQVGQDGMVDFSITTTLPQGPDAYTRAVTNPNSALGGLANVDTDTHDLRYIMEVWTTGTSPKRVYRKVTTVLDNWASTPAIFDARLIAQKYNFVFWADFVTQGTEADLHYTTTGTGLNNIQFTGDYKVSDDTRDAYFHKEEIDLTVSTNKIAVSLKRPFAKVRFIATDRPLNDVTNSNLVPTSSAIEYPDAVFYTEFNAITGAAIGTPSVRDNATLLTAKPTAEGVTGDYLLVFDYILPGASVTSIGESNISTVIDGITASRPNLPTIPIVANTLVTLKGNLYSNRGVVTVSVDDAFEDKEEEVLVADIETVKLIGDIDDVIKNLAIENAVDKTPIGVKVETEIIESVVVSIPASILASDIPAITYDLSAGITSGATLTIGNVSENADEGTTYAGTINVIVPETNVGNVKINAPQAHVTINGNYATLTAATSPTTLVIEAGATIETLTVTAGNIEIYGKVTNFTNNGNGTVTEYVSSLAKLEIALNRASVINLTGDIDGLKTRIKVDSLVIINGNNHTVNVTLLGGFNPTKSLTLNNITLNCNNTVGKAPIFINTSNVTIIGNYLTINQAALGSGAGTGTSGLGIHVDHGSGINNAKIELNNSAINLNATSGQRAIAFSSGVEQSGMVVNLTNTKIISKTSESYPNAHFSQAFALAKLAAPKITLTNSVLEGMYYPINCAGDSPTNMQLTIDNSKITGYCALNLRGTSTINIKNGSVITGRNYYSGDSDDFATIIYNKDENCNGSNLIVDNSTIQNIAKGLARQYMIDLRANAVAITLQNNTKLIDCPEAPALELDFMIKEGASANPLTYDKTTVLIGKEGVTFIQQSQK